MKAPAVTKVMKAKQAGGGIVGDALRDHVAVEKAGGIATKAKIGKISTHAAKHVASGKAVRKRVGAKHAQVCKGRTVKKTQEGEASVTVTKAMKTVQKTNCKRGKFAGKLAKAAGAALKLKRTVAAEKENNVTVIERTKELKAMKVADLKELVINKGLEKGVKEDMIKSILGLEARIRKEAAAQEARIREVIARKRQELSAQSSTELKDLLADKMLKLGGAKDERVERLLAHWREQGEVEKVLAAEVHAARREELSNMDKAALKDLCDKVGVDALVKEVLVERLLSHEYKA